MDNAYEFLEKTFGFDKISNDNNYKYTTEDELNDLWREYNDLVNSLKEDGYKVMRTDDGRHKVAKIGE